MLVYSKKIERISGHGFLTSP